MLARKISASSGTSAGRNGRSAMVGMGGGAHRFTFQLSCRPSLSSSSMPMAVSSSRMRSASLKFWPCGPHCGRRSAHRPSARHAHCARARQLCEPLRAVPAARSRSSSTASDLLPLTASVASACSLGNRLRRVQIVGQRIENARRSVASLPVANVADRCVSNSSVSEALGRRPSPSSRSAADSGSAAYRTAAPRPASPPATRGW